MIPNDQSLPEIDLERIHDVKVQRFDRGRFTVLRDDVAAEEPFEIRIAGRSLAIIMRTPGHDYFLAAGFLLTEGVVERPDDLVSCQAGVDRDGFPERNVLDVRLPPELEVNALNRSRGFTVTSSCGLCGAASIEEACSRASLVESGVQTTPATLLGLDATMRAAQSVFSRTGGLHAAGLFSATGHPIVLREDIGRHNAVDKVIGEMFVERRLPLSTALLMVSGRASFELVQKAAIAGIPILAAIGAPSSLAVEAANQLGLTLVGMLRSERFVVYSHPERIEGAT